MPYLLTAESDRQLRQTVEHMKPTGGSFMGVKPNIDALERCRAENRHGKPCAAPPARGAQYCSLHLHPGRAAEIGKLGGVRNRHPVFQESGQAILVLDTAEEGDLPFRGSLELADLERRVRELEEFKRNAEALRVPLVPTTSEPAVEKVATAMGVEASARDFSMKPEERPKVLKLSPQVPSAPRTGIPRSQPAKPVFGSIEYLQSRRRRFMR
jgi:hypothetical protein